MIEVVLFLAAIWFIWASIMILPVFFLWSIVKLHEVWSWAMKELRL